jgi:hypothetical protein
MIVKHAQSTRHHILLLGIQERDEESMSDGRCVKVEAELDGKIWSIIISLEESKEALQEDLERYIQNIEQYGEMP